MIEGGLQFDDDGMCLIHGEALETMRAMPDNCVDLIATDPPYFKVKGEAWDRQWDKPEQFLAWINELCEQWHRILKPNGSLYCFASPRMAARVEVEVGRRFCVVNRITWSKPIYSTRAGMFRKEDLRGFFPNTESIIFAEHQNADNIAKGEAGYAAKCDELRGFVFEPLRAYLAGERDRAGMTTASVNSAWQEARGTKGQMAGHWFERVQWALPTAENYAWLQRIFNAQGGEYLRREYEDLRREYEDLRREYEDLRRPFNVTADVPFTDVWTFSTVQAYKGKHPCEKPLEMMEHLVSVSSREGAVVLDCFMGSGTTGVAAKNLGRRFVGIEMGDAYFEQAKERIGQCGKPERGSLLEFIEQEQERQMELPT